MMSLQVLTIAQGIIDNISDNEQLYLLQRHITKRCMENTNQKYKSHYLHLEDGTFDNRIINSNFTSNDGVNFDVEGNEIRYRFNIKLENVPLLIRSLKTHECWRFSGTQDNFTIEKCSGFGLNLNHSEPPKEILDHALFLWKYKP
jgi:mRNA-degrading endonuclease HigB of HigAB toxin-antitoxin module